MPQVQTPALDIGYEEHGPIGGPPVVLVHGFPDDVRVWDGVTGPLAQAGCRVLVPYLRGYGPTRLRPGVMASGQQAALGVDLRDFLAALGINRATLAGYDWGGRAACVVAALWPEQVHALVSITGYNIQNIASALRPASVDDEWRHWYQWYFQTERGRAGLAANRAALSRKLWQLWSPNWPFDEAVFARTATSFDNPDFVDVVIHSYRHRHQAAAGDPALDSIEQALAALPAIAVPTVVLHGADDGVGPAENSMNDHRHFTAFYDRIVVPGAGHFLPREAPTAVIDAIERLHAMTNAIF